MNRWLVMLLGMGTVFIGLVCLILLTKLMSFFVAKFSGKDKAKPADAQSQSDGSAYETPVAAIADRPAFDAAVASAIASYMGTDISGLRILSVKRVGQAQDDRPRFVAAISAAIAETIGTNLSGLRIRSIKKV